ncbi:MAG: hypothetical protein LUP97_02805 [Methanoregula sp.]|nr:hypothetical protein [Methanoregula sp.]
MRGSLPGYADNGECRPCTIPFVADWLAGIIRQVQAGTPAYVIGRIR